MKLTLISILVFTLHVSASVYSQTQKFDLSFKNVSVKEVFRAIEAKSDFRFFYNDELSDVNRLVTVNFENMKVEDVLSQLFMKSDVTYKVLENNLIVITPTGLVIQKNTVTGMVTDQTNNEPLPGVNITVEGTTLGTVSDASGKYSIDLPSTNAVLLFSFVGYNTERVETNGRLDISIGLIPDIKKLEEVVVIGYGSRAKRDVTTAISSISNDAVEKTLSMSPELAMQGRMTGVQVTGNSGNPMARNTIRIRGVNTWGVASPLYIIDGIPITEFGAGIEGQEDPRAQDVRGPLNIMTMIDPNDIESISVLKDASAAAIYGVRAANGVILITTKKGKGDKPTIEFSTRFGVQNIDQKTDVLNTQQYTDFVNKVLLTDPTIELNPDNAGRFDANSPRYLGNSDTYDWQDAIKNKNALSKEYSIRLSGGTAKTDYFVSASSTSNEGAFKFNYLDRLSGSFKINSQVNKWLKMGVNYRITSGEGKDNDVNYIDYAAYPPWQKIHDPAAPYGYAPVVVGRKADGSYSSEKLYGSGTRINSLGQRASSDSDYKSLRNMASAYVEIEPIKHLKIKGSSSFDIYNFTRYNFEDFDGTVFDYTAGDRSALSDGNSVGSYEERDVFNNNYINEITINYANVFGKHNIDLLLNGSDQQYNSKYRGASTSWMQSKLEHMRRLGGETKYLGLGSDITNSALQGLMGRIGYNYNSTYYLDVTVRRDGSTRFSEDKRWGTFPSASVAWRISNENFFKGITFINDLKFRAGWGQLGNQEVRDMAYLSPIRNNPVFTWGNDPTKPGYGIRMPGAAVYSLINPDLEWEKTSTTNVGFDASMLNGNLTFSAEYFNKLTTGILQTITLPTSVGLIEMPSANIASVRNTGFEFSANYAGTAGDFTYNIGGNFSTVKNIVEETSGHIPLWNIEEGYSMHYIKGYKVAGMFQTADEVADWLSKNSDDTYAAPKVAPGDYYYQDLRSAPNQPNTFYKDSADNKVSPYDQVFLGKTIPGFYYGMNLSAAYKGLDLSAQFTGVGDVMKENRVKWLENTGTTNMNVSTKVLNAWTPENPNNSVPRVINGDPAGNFRYSDRFIESAAYLRLTNLQIGYTLPKSFYGFVNNHVSNLRIYAGASNLLTITKYSGYDPENDNYPSPKIFFMGLNVRF